MMIKIFGKQIFVEKKVFDIHQLYIMINRLIIIPINKDK